MIATQADQPFFFSTSTMPAAGDPHRPVAAAMPGTAATAGDELVQRARREIAEIVREVAHLSRQTMSRELFFSALIDRTSCAIAAQGVVIWDCRDHLPITVVRTGQTTDASIPDQARAAHECLLREVVRSGTPVVVPSTPAAIDAHLPSNPTAYPVAVVPIIDVPIIDAPLGDNSAASSTPRFVLEVFLEAEAGLATQRGYLRFVAQMADLATEFLRSDEIREARRRQRMQAQTSQALVELHELGSSTAIAAAIVDFTAEQFQAARVSLARLGSGKPRLLAVSHIESIDHRGQASRNLLSELTSLTLTDDTRLRTSFTLEQSVRTALPTVNASPDAALYPLGLARDAGDQLRLYLQDYHSRAFDDLTHWALDDWSRQSLSILTSRLQLESVPLAKFYLAVTPKYISISPSRLRRSLTTIAAMAVVILIACIPTPMVVTIPATLRPAGTRIHYAPSDAVVERVEVKHGQKVAVGDVLIRLRDWAIEEQIATLSARRGVLRQRLTRSIASLVEAPGTEAFSTTHRSTVSDEDLVQQQRLIEEEIAGLDEQIELVEATRDRLTIRADQAGRVDAWQTELTAKGRPVRRGDSLVRVEPYDAKWMVDAKIAQSRVSVVLERLRQDPKTVVQVATVAHPERSYPAMFTRRAMAAEPTSQRLPLPTGTADGALAIELAIQADAADGQEAIHATSAADTKVAVPSSDWTHAAPATVTIECNRRPLVRVVFFDLERAVRRAWARWI